MLACSSTSCRHRVDRCEAQDLLWYHHEFVLERREHEPGCAGLSHTGLETPDAGSNCTLPRCHGYLVVRWLLEIDFLVSIGGTFWECFWFVSRWLPESARWLLVNGQAEKAKQFLVQCAKMNGRHEAIATLDTEVKLEDASTSLLKENE